MALCIPAVGESYDCARGLCPNSPDPFSLTEGAGTRWGLGTRLCTYVQSRVYDNDMKRSADDVRTIHTNCRLDFLNKNLDRPTEKKKKKKKKKKKQLRGVATSHTCN